jgi:serine/threonine protein kinase
MLYVAHGVLEALIYAHAQTDAQGAPLGLVHRDVSPGNIMVTDRGEVKLFDFGIVKAIGRISKSETGVVKGHIALMSSSRRAASRSIRSPISSRSAWSSTTASRTSGSATTRMARSSSSDGRVTGRRPRS